MRTRLIGWTAATIALAMLVAGATVAAAAHLKDSPRKHKVVYHLDEPSVDKAKFVLGNIRNTIEGVGGWQNIEALELVVNGPALQNFVTKTMDPDLRRALADLQKQGLAFGACGNTMSAFQITMDQLPEGAHRLAQGGVVRVMELQEQGYSYIRP